MRCIFIYNHQEIDFTPVDIIFQQNYHQYSQIYIICSLFIEIPEKIVIKNLFTGEFIFSKPLNDNLQAIYFVNENFKIDSNRILYLDSYTNKLITDGDCRILHMNKLKICSLQQEITQHLPRYLDINHQNITMDSNSEIIQKNIFHLGFSKGIGYKNVNFQKIDISYIKSYVENMIIQSQHIRIEMPLFYESIRIGDIIHIYDKEYRILFIKHKFLTYKTIIKCHIHVRNINISKQNYKKIPSKTQELNSINIYTPELIEKHHKIQVDADI
jgi:hypothetical protein